MSESSLPPCSTQLLTKLKLDHALVGLNQFLQVFGQQLAVLPIGENGNAPILVAITNYLGSAWGCLIVLRPRYAQNYLQNVQNYF